MGCLFYPRKQTSVSYAADCDVIACYDGAKLTDKHLAAVKSIRSSDLKVNTIAGVDQGEVAGLVARSKNNLMFFARRVF
jgi:hypothetical protein